MTYSQTMFKILSGLVITGFVLLANVSPANSYSWMACNDTPITWSELPVHFHIRDCSIPDGSAEHDDVVYSFRKWNDYSDPWTPVFTHETSYLDCFDEPPEYNGKNEVYATSQAAIDGAGGRSFVRYDPESCTWAWTEQEIVESDIAIASDYDPRQGQATVCDGHPNRLYAIHVWIHEMGHAIGLQHENRNLASMNEVKHSATYCGDHKFAPFPDDVAGLRFLYPQVDTATDLAVSAHRYNPLARDDPKGEQFAKRTMPKQTKKVCPGDIYYFTLSALNHFDGPHLFNFAVYLSDDENITIGSDFLVKDYGLMNLPGERVQRWDQAVRIPADAPVGEHYFVVHIEEYASEVRQDNNGTYLAERISVAPSFVCDGDPMYSWDWFPTWDFWPWL